MEHSAGEIKKVQKNAGRAAFLLEIGGLVAGGMIIYRIHILVRPYIGNFVPTDISMIISLLGGEFLLSILWYVIINSIAGRHLDIKEMHMALADSLCHRKIVNIILESNYLMQLFINESTVRLEAKKGTDYVLKKIEDDIAKMLENDKRNYAEVCK